MSKALCLIAFSFLLLLDRAHSQEQTNIDALFERLGPDSGGRVRLTKGELKELLRSVASRTNAGHGTRSSPVSSLSISQEFLLLDKKPSDGALTRAQVKEHLVTGRLTKKAGVDDRAVIRAIFPQDANFLTVDAYSKARMNGTLGFAVIDEKTAAARLETFTFEDEDRFKLEDHLSITASGLGDKKAKGPASFAWVRDRKDMVTTSRWEVDGKVELSGLDLLSSTGIRQSLEPFARAEARIVDYNSREANEAKGALNHLRYGAGLDWVINGPKGSGVGHIVRVEGEYETDPANDYRNMTALLTYTRIVSDWGINSVKGAGWFGQRWTYTVQPILGLQYGEYDKEVADRVEALGPPSVVKLGGGVETVTQLQQRNRVITNDDIQRALFVLNLQMTLNERLALNATYKGAANIAGDNEVFHFGEVQLSYRVTPVENDLIVALVASYLVGQDAPTYERADVLRLGLGIEF